jgi:hypothetical protein
MLAAGETLIQKTGLNLRFCKILSLRKSSMQQRSCDPNPISEPDRRFGNFSHTGNLDSK